MPGMPMMTLPFRTTRRTVLAAAALAAPARAQEAYPSRPVTITVPWAPGGSTDILARTLAEPLRLALGQPVVVENRSGASGNIGSAAVARAAPDGHSLLFATMSTHAMNAALMRDMPFDGVEDFTAIALLAFVLNTMVIHPAVPARTVPEFIAHLKANPGRLSFGSPGVGQSPHLTGVWFNQATGTQAIHVPFRGAGPAAMELVAGNINYMWDNLTSGIQQIRGGRVRALAVSSADRNPQLPDVPAARETMPELAKFDVNTWFGIFLPAATPRPIAESLNAAMKAWHGTEEVQARWREMGGVSLYGSTTEFAAFVSNEVEKWGEVIRKEGLQLEVG